MVMTDSMPTADASGLNIADWRQIQAGDVVTTLNGGPRTGVLPATFAPIVSGTSGMSYAVAPFNAITSRVGGNTAEKVANDAATTVATSAAPASNSRIDVIWVRAQFVSSSDANNLAVLGVTQGTAAAVPTKPGIPAGALELATAVVPSTATATNTVVITQTARYTCLAGGTIPIRNQAQEDALTGAVLPGQTIYRIDQQLLKVWDTVLWRRLNGYVVPTSLTGATFDPATGRIIPTAGSKGFRADGVFGTEFVRYRMDYSYYTGDSNGNALQLRSGGTTYSGTNYNYQLILATNSTVLSVSSAGLQQMGVAGASESVHFGYIEFTNMAQTSSFSQKNIHGQDGSRTQLTSFSGHVGLVDTTLFDGIDFFLSNQGMNSFVQAASWFKITPIA